MGLRQKRVDFFLIGSALLAAFLNIYGIWRDQYANAYYTAAVTSMLQSFHNFFFASFDPGGFVTVDKPPVAFWVQTLFASVFGVHGWSVILPQALAGVGSVLLIYVLIKPTFGRAGARLAALVMACTPVAAAISRTNNVDSILVFTLLLGTWLLFKGIKRNSPLRCIAAFAVIGVAFNIKMFQAYMVLPAFYLLFWLAFKVNWKKKIGILALSTVVMLIISFSWAVAVDSTPQADRPYIGSSQTNSVFELAFGYNGLSRLIGQNGMGGGNRGGFADRSGRNQSGQPPEGSQFQPPTGGNQPEQQPEDGQFQPSGNDQYQSDGGQQSDDNQWRVPGGNNASPWMGEGGLGGRGPGGSGMFNTGKAGPLRLFQSELSGQISWLLPFALLSAAALLIGLRRKKPLSDKEKEGMFWLMWLLPMMVFFSVAGFFHQYYLVMLAPAIAALTGAGWVELYGFYQNRQKGKRWLLPLGVLGTTAFQVYILWPYRTQIGIIWPIGVGAAGVVIAAFLCVARNANTKFNRFMAVGGMLVLLAAPLYWSATPLIYGGNSQLPAAGPQLKSDRGNGMNGMGGQMEQNNVDNQLLAYLEANNTGEKFLFATTNAGTAEAYIIQSGKAVMAMGGFSGSDPILTVDKLKQMVADGEVKYFLVSGGGMGGGGRGDSDVLSWVEQNGKQVLQSAWQSGTGGSALNDMGTGRGEILYEVSQ